MEIKITESIHINEEEFLELLLFKARIKKWGRDIQEQPTWCYREGGRV